MDDTIQQTESTTKKSFFRRSPSPTVYQMGKHILPQAVESTAVIMSTTAAATGNAGQKIATKPIAKVLQSGSATGNPRNKCALKPGHSLMDWVRLGSSGCDLAGTNGILTPVSHIELAKHNRRDDAWLAIRGKVYNVTRYMDFHPGGVDEMMKGVGIDATKLFDEVHAWVNYEQLLAKCLIGPLRNTVTLNIASTSSTKSSSSTVNNIGNRTKERTKTITPNGDRFKAPFLPFMSLDKSKLNYPAIPHIEIVPRFDWIQKMTDLTLVFYTKTLCNPGILVHGNSDKTTFDIFVQIEHMLHVFNFKLLHQVEWPPVASVVNHDTGKIEIVLNKTVPALWTNFGLLNRRKLTDDLSHCNYVYKIDQRTRISHDSYVIDLHANHQILHRLPIGYHVSVSANLPDDCTVSRSYTPIPPSYVPSITCDATAHLLLLIKSYADGNFTKHIGANEMPFSEVTVSHAKGNFKLDNVNIHTRVAILAAGSGITPMLSVIDHLLQRKRTPIEKLNILYFNKTEADIWCRDVFDSLAKTNDRIQVRYILSGVTESQQKWSGEIGRMRSEISKSLANKTSASYSTFCLGCGPQPFISVCQSELGAVGFKDDCLHFFHG